MHPRLKRILLGLYALLLLPALQVGTLTFVNPQRTVPMLLRQSGNWWKQPKVTENQYHWQALRAGSEDFLKCVWIAEDHRFFEHWGFDGEEIRKAYEEANALRVPPRGASTITQQCARSLFLWPGRSWLRKGLEAYYTLWMELLLSKERILELYVNAIELGEGVYGVEAAARHHFDVSASELTREQAALLVAIMPNPRQWSPIVPNERVRRRQAMILHRSDNVVLPLPE